MPGRIKADDVALVKERSSIEDVVREHVTLRPAGPGSMKGLCPFHDEKTPSFNIRPVVGAWHCFGCGEGGDVISFVQKVEHLTFTEAIERLAQKLGMELHYEEGGKPGGGESLGRRSRLIEAHRVAQEFYHHALLNAPEARAGRDFLRERGFDSEAAKRFGVGFAPRGGEDLSRHLRSKGFTDEEVVLGGLSGRGSRGLYDRFRGRLVWPIRDITGDTVGFGARRLYDDDRIAAKYLNTSETPIYKKSTVLYGLDLAKKSIAGERKAVIVEGYTDVMACQLAGIEGAVATCGTAFGVDHIKMLRRIMRDEVDLAPAKVVFTFDGDAAGQKAAMRSFGEDQRWASQSFVAVADGGMDPCELRIAKGDDAVRHLIDDAVPMFEFAVRTTIDRFDMVTAEGRVQAMRAAAPIVNSIRDSSMRPEYIRTVAGWIGVEVEQVQAEVSRAQRAAARDAKEAKDAPQGAGGRPGGSRDAGSGGSRDAGAGGFRPDADTVPEPSIEEARASLPTPDLRDPIVFAERQLLQTLLQYPDSFALDDVDKVSADAFTAPAHRAVFDGVRGAGGPQRGLSVQAWADRVTQAAPLAVHGLVAELSVASLPTRFDKATGLPERRYIDALLTRVQEVSLTRRIADAMSAMRRMATDSHSDPAAARTLSTELQELQRELATLRDSAS
ncbi:DNA primase [Pedococcus bigeumensis]|uniref:DNA primase n=1 Tax=Pedococcus bigeumensis TaxID=433644 RepID=A0A502D3G5_9MICO|nr:DNA primase [Pedococcus bigeumensis]TPG19613.1 DNA primase [Pedococcus bigeumensis]